MTSPANTSTGDDPTPDRAGVAKDRLVKAGLIGAAALTVTWWAVIACAMWRVIEWAVV